jgi:hypothetical protein
MMIILLRHSKNSRGSFLPLEMPYFIVVFDEIANLLVDEKLAIKKGPPTLHRASSLVVCQEAVDPWDDHEGNE